MELEALLAVYQVWVQNRLNELGLVSVGKFKSRQSAAQFLADVRGLPGVYAPTGYNPVWPPDAEPCEVHINIGADHALFPRHDHVV